MLCLAELRAAVGNVPGFYWLKQCDDHGDPIEDAPPAFISIAPSPESVPIGEVDPRDAFLRNLAQATAEVVRMIVEHFGNGAAADTLGAAPGAGLSRRQEEESESTAHSNPASLARTSSISTRGASASSRQGQW